MGLYFIDRHYSKEIFLCCQVLNKSKVILPMALSVYTLKLKEMDSISLLRLVSADFEGLRLVQRHQKVYAALGDTNEI